MLVDIFYAVHSVHCSLLISCLNKRDVAPFKLGFKEYRKIAEKQCLFFHVINEIKFLY